MWNLVCLCVLILHCKLCVPSHFVQKIPLKPGLEVSFHRGFAFASVRLLMESSTQGYCKVHSQPEVYEWLEDVNLVCEPMWRLVLLQIFRASVLLAGQIFPLFSDRQISLLLAGYGWMLKGQVIPVCLYTLYWALFLIDSLSWEWSCQFVTPVHLETLKFKINLSKHPQTK